MLRRQSRRACAALALAVALLAPLAVPASAAPSGRVASVAVLSPTWVKSGAQLPAGVRIVVRGGAVTAVTVQLRATDASGRVRWTSSQTRNGLAAATYDLSFPVSTRAQGLGAGIYTLEASVQAGSARAVERSRALFVVDPAMPKVPVSVIVRVAGTPAVGIGGAQSPDQPGDLRTAQDAQALGTLAVVHPEFHLTAAVPPYLLAEWAAALPNDANSLGGEEQTRTVGADAMQSLRTAVEGGMPLLRAGYGEPDMSTLATTTSEIARQLAAGDAARYAALAAPAGAPGSVAATGFGVASGLVPANATSILASAGVTYLVLDPGSLAPPAHNATTAPVPHRVRIGAGSKIATVTALVADRPDAALLADPTQSDALAEGLYARAMSQLARYPVVLEVEVGAQGAATSDVAKSLAAVALLPWVRLVDAPSAAMLPAAGSAKLRPKPKDPTPAPGALQNADARARNRLNAYEAAVGARAGTATVEALLLSESRSWAGADGTWALSDRAGSLASAADAAAWNVLSKVTIDAPSVTLPGSEGRVPVSIVNGSGQTLRVVLEASSSQMRVRSQRIGARLAPGENILSVPVALGNARVGRLHLAVTAGGLALARTTATVSASYLDRIVLLGAAVLVLIVLLIYIRRRMARGAKPGTKGRRRHAA